MNSIFKLYLAAIPISTISVAINEYGKYPISYNYMNYNHFYHSINEGFEMGVVTAFSPLIVPVVISHYFYKKFFL